jgi:glutamate-1-semialdehyde 2,1-aminomutase
MESDTLPQGCVAVDVIDAALEEAHRRYVDRRPRTAAAHAQASAVLPGGNTRSVLWHAPFPIRVAGSHDAVLEDLDGLRYVDLLGNYSAGLFGHAHPVIVEAVRSALCDGLGPGAHTMHEVALAEAVCARWPSIERVRFTNSGTEANLMALAAARAFTGRERVMVFSGAYHGGVLTFAGGRAGRGNAPYDVVILGYNDLEAAAQALHAEPYACVLVEPMLGSAGCIPGERGFLETLRAATRATGALLVFDEVMTSRTGRSGLQGRLGITPDLTTLGKYVGGGLSSGAFGGSAAVMDLFDPARPDSLGHAGTFNNNVASMVAGLAGLTQLFTAEVAEQHTARGDRLRADLDAVFRETGAPMCVTGVGSLLNVHATTVDVRRPEDLATADSRLLELLFLGLLEEGYYVAPRGYLALSLAVTDEQLAGFVDAVRRVVSRF